MNTISNYSANNHNSTQILVKGYKEIFRNTTDNPKIIVEQEGNKARLIMLLTIHIMLI